MSISGAFAPKPLIVTPDCDGDALPHVVPSPKLLPPVQVHAAQPAVDPAHRDSVQLAGQHRAARVGERNAATAELVRCRV